MLGESVTGPASNSTHLDEGGERKKKKICGQSQPLVPNVRCNLINKCVRQRIAKVLKVT